jgi:hypothetical protein
MKKEIFEAAAWTSDRVKELTETPIAREEIKPSPKIARRDGGMVLRL